MSRNNEKETTPDSINETKEDISSSPIEEMDEVVEPLIKRVTIMASRLAIVSAFTLGVVLSAPVIGLADQPIHNETPTPQVEELSEEPPGLLDRVWKKTVDTGTAIKGNAVSAWKGMTNEDEKLERAREQVKFLTEKNAELKQQLVEKRVRAATDHGMHLTCLRGAVDYMKRIEPEVN